MKKVRNDLPSSSSRNQQEATPPSRPSSPKLRVVPKRNRNLIQSERRNRDKFSGARINQGSEPREPSAVPPPALSVLSPGKFQEAARIQTGAAVSLTQASPLTQPSLVRTQTGSRSQQQQQQQPVTTAAAQQPRKFNFEQTLKDFGFNPQLLTSSPFINDTPKENVVTKKQQLQRVQSFPSAKPGLGQAFTGRGRITEKNQNADVSPQPVISPPLPFQPQAQPISSADRAPAAPSFSRGQSRGRSVGDRGPGLSSLLANAGDPQECFKHFEI